MPALSVHEALDALPIQKHRGAGAGQWTGYGASSHRGLVLLPNQWACCNLFPGCELSPNGICGHRSVT